MKVDFPKESYIQRIEVNEKDVDIQFAPKKKIALLLISINPNYWPYLKDVIRDCKEHFLPHHNVDFYAWTDIPDKNDTKSLQQVLDVLPPHSEIEPRLKMGKGIHTWSKEIIEKTVKTLWEEERLTLTPTEGIEWPAPTLMRYHLFLQKEEELKDYDYIFYMDADMRVVGKISDEVLGEGLTAAQHPMYALKSSYIPPYEPNEDSTAYIKRLGQIVDDKGKPRFLPLYLAGGFQGGRAKPFIKAMKVMKENIDKDFNNNYTAIWNDESHWNKYLFDYDGPLQVLSPAYVYPDSLIKEYYEPLWGCSYDPKIITLTKPFSLSAEAGDALNEMLGRPKAPPPFECPDCHDRFEYPGHQIIGVDHCPGTGKPHPLNMKPTTS